MAIDYSKVKVKRTVDPIKQAALELAISMNRTNNWPKADALVKEAAVFEAYLIGEKK